VYVKIGNLIVSMIIHIQNPCLHGGVISELCHNCERERKEETKCPRHAHTWSGGHSRLSVLYTGSGIDLSLHVDSVSSPQMSRLFCVAHNVPWLSLFDSCCPRA
jgi:hypothetical protein